MQNVNHDKCIPRGYGIVKPDYIGMSFEKFWMESEEKFLQEVNRRAKKMFNEWKYCTDNDCFYKEDSHELTEDEKKDFEKYIAQFPQHRDSPYAKCK